ncbi:MAG TPA: ATP-binding protein, partial [Nevskiaceae bacterium]|nr:ATP-binding protein [Nevskiaceae bacterium]
YRKTAALERMNRELEQRVAERTAELERDLATRKQLEEALVDAGRRKDEFLAVLAHELRNPLAPIRTAVELMHMRPLSDPAVVHSRDVIGRQVEHLTRLVDDLLDVSRITRGKIRLEMEPLEIEAAVNRAIETNRPIFESRGQRLTVRVPDSPVIVRADMTRLSEAIGNLLNNAAKYTDEGGEIVLSVDLSDDARLVAVRVKDSGMGIPPEMLPKVFELFTQVDHTLHRAQGGLGIGLALVRRLMEMHGGTVEGHSDGVGKGSEFVLRLPVHDQAVAAAAARPEAGGLGRPLKRILVVDHNRDAAETLAMVLRLNGGEVETAHDGREAVEAAERFRPHVVLLDLGMPGINGLEVARTIRAQPWGSDMTLVAQTGWGQEEDRRRTTEAGFDDHLTKPMDHSKLLQLLARPSPRAAQVSASR